MDTATATDFFPQMFSAIFVVVVAYLAAFFVPLYIPKAYRHIKKAFAPQSKPIQACPNPAIEVSQASEFPSDWWTSPAQYSLETRAILEKTWLHLCHSSMLQRAGSYKTFSIASHSILLIRGKDRVLRAFHNICRHRAYTVTTKSEGCSQVLMCKYHGWTYDSKGKLIRAPKFEDVAGFDRSQNGLFEVRTYTDSSGFVYVNLDVYGSDGLTIRVGVPIRAKLQPLESWTVDAPFNWKLAVPHGSFRIASMATRSQIPDWRRLMKGDFDSWRWAAEFELSPLTHLIRSAKGDLWLTISVVPGTVAASKIACALYTSENENATAKFSIDAIKAEVKASIDELEKTFAVIKQGDTSSEHGQYPLLAECKAHLRLERFMGKEVHPASRLRESSRECKIADDLCQQLENEARPQSADSARSLEW